jgi:hypothetical protein
MKLFTTTAAVALFATTLFAEDIGGKQILITNTYEDKTTGGELYWTHSTFAKMGKDVELPSYINLYDIEASAERIEYTWVETDFSKRVGGVLPEGQYDRNYFAIELPEGQKIMAITLDPASEMPEGSSRPTAKVISNNMVMTEFGPGVARVTGFNPDFNITLGPVGE